MIRQGKDTDKETLMQMWKYCFPQDTIRFIHFYFDKVYANNETLVYVENNQAIASMQIIPFQIKTGDSFVWGGYISGAMTHPDHRKKGYMAHLLTASFDYMRERNYAYTFLIPQEEYLIDYYGKFGYERAFPIYNTHYHCRMKPILSENVSIYTDFSAVNHPFLYSVYSHYLMKKNNAVLRSETQFLNILWDFFDGNGVLFVNDENIAFTFKNENTIILTDFFYKNEETKIELLQTISAYYSEKEMIFRNDPSGSGSMSGYKGMIKSLNDSAAVKNDIYMGRMFE